MKFENCINKIKTFVPFRSITPTFSLRVVSRGVLFATLVLVGSNVVAGPREQAKRMHDRLAGVPPTEAVLCAMEYLLGQTNGAQQAAHLVMSLDPTADARIPSYAGAVTACAAVGPVDNSASRKAFYSTSLRDFATPWTNRAQTKYADLNDYVALVIGMIRDEDPFDTVLSTNVYYQGGAGASGVRGWSEENNNHYIDLGNGGHDLSDTAVLQRGTRVPPTGASAADIAGVTTTRAAGLAFFSKGTNRRMFRFTAINYLCRDLEQMKDPTRSHDRVRQDVSRSPGGDSKIFLTNCVGCHAGMDPMAGAYAYWEWMTVDDGDGNPLEGAGKLLFKQNYTTTDETNATAFATVTAVDAVDNPNGVTNKHHINAGNFSYGYRTIHDGWVNRWREGPNSSLDWEFNQVASPAAQGQGNGAASMGREIAGTKAFAQCQVEKVYKHVCLQNPVEADEVAMDNIITEFRSESYNMRNVFAKVAPLCRGN
ncbi:MAG: hypothetical protein OEZ68_19720 [Gammaproteobacteria bacterium]|nr:hypothetical protein [Gammaproteobacteria bacterium]MDH5803039.1 hypothetical protein [Gammaproteobacteria bacterium]